MLFRLGWTQQNKETRLPPLCAPQTPIGWFRPTPDWGHLIYLYSTCVLPCSRNLAGSRSLFDSVWVWGPIKVPQSPGVAETPRVKGFCFKYSLSALPYANPSQPLRQILRWESPLLALHELGTTMRAHSPWRWSQRVLLRPFALGSLGPLWSQACRWS